MAWHPLFGLILPGLEHHIHGIIQYVLFCVWLLLVNTVSIRFSHSMFCIHQYFYFLKFIFIKKIYIYC